MKKNNSSGNNTNKKIQRKKTPKPVTADIPPNWADLRSPFGLTVGILGDINKLAALKLAETKKMADASPETVNSRLEAIGKLNKGIQAATAKLNLLAPMAKREGVVKDTDFMAYYNASIDISTVSTELEQLLQIAIPE